MQFRDYRMGDFEKLNAFWKSLDMGGEERGDNEEVVLRTLAHGGKLIILEDGDKIIGSSWMTSDARRLYLHHFGISKSHQRQGLGMKLAEESMKFIREKGLQVKLEVHKENIAAKRLYEKVGFFAFTEYDIYMVREVKS